MHCITPVHLKDQNFAVPCGRCNFCLSTRRAQWAFRLTQELKESDNAFFVTLTYDDEHIQYGNKNTGTLVKEHLQKFHKLIKQQCKRDNKDEYKIDLKALKYYGVGEYGSETSRPHYHTLLFNCHPESLRKLVDKGRNWPYGSVHVGNVTEQSINYVAKYIIDRDMDSEDQKPFSNMSKGLGKKYLEHNYNWHKDNLRPYVINGSGLKIGIPRYYKQAIFDEHERKLLQLKGEENDNMRTFEEWDRLEKMGVIDWREYLKEKKQRDHDRIKVKSIKKNSKF